MRRAMPRTFVALVTLATLACAPKEGSNSADTSVRQMGMNSDPATVRPAIDSALARFSAAMIRGDAAGMSFIYADDAAVFFPNAKAARGRTEIDKANAGMFTAFSVPAFRTTTGELIVSGDYAIETGTYDMTIKPKTGKTIHDVGKFVTIWKKQPDGSWKIFRDIFNTDTPAT